MRVFMYSQFVITQVFMFSVNNKNWRNYNWDKLTTLAYGYTDPELMCYAHNKKTRVVATGKCGVHVKWKLFNSSSVELSPSG